MNKKVQVNNLSKAMNKIGFTNFTTCRNEEAIYGKASSFCFTNKDGYSAIFNQLCEPGVDSRFFTKKYIGNFFSYTVVDKEGNFVEFDLSTEDFSVLDYTSVNSDKVSAMAEVVARSLLQHKVIPYIKF